MLKKIISSIIVTCMLASIGTSVMAERNNFNVETLSSGIIMEPMEVENSIESDTSTIIDLPSDSIPLQPDHGSLTDLSYTSEIDVDKVTGVDLESISQKIPLDNKNSRSMNYNLYEFKGTISVEGDIASIGPVELQPGQICQAQMYMPNNPNLEYDLYLYEIDADGNFIAPVVDISAYTGTLVPEAVAVANRSSVAKTYYVIPASRVGASATDEFIVYSNLI